MSKIAVIGSGFSSMSAAAYLARAGHVVEVFEKNSGPGGRASVLRAKGYTFDMGPSWYWMPDIIEDFFSDFGKKTSDYFKLTRLDPSYRVIFPENEVLDIPANFEELRTLFESIEKGAGSELDEFMDSAQKKYEIGIREFASLPGNSPIEYLKFDLLKNAPSMELLSSFKKMVDRRFQNEKLRLLLYFPILFLGVPPENCPAMYSLMNYADMKLGTWYPEDGMHSLAIASMKLAEEQGVKFNFKSEVEHINTLNQHACGIQVSGNSIEFDAVLAGADYHHVDQSLLKSPSYSSKYWDKRVMSPSSLLFYVGIDKRVEGLEHHNLFFDTDLDQHSDEIYNNPKWPSDPLFYVCCPSITDQKTAPKGKENLFILMPLGPGLKDSEELRTQYKNIIFKRLSQHVKQDLVPHIEFIQSYCISDFEKDYNSFKGNAYGLANTLKQTGFLKPKIRNKVIENLYHCGQLTTPGPGVPPALMSGKIAALELLKDFTPDNTVSHEASV